MRDTTYSPSPANSLRGLTTMFTSPLRSRLTRREYQSVLTHYLYIRAQSSLLPSPIGNKGERIRAGSGRGEGFPADHLPTSVIGEESVRPRGKGIHLGEPQLLRQRESLPIDLRTPYHEHFPQRGASPQGFLQRGADLQAGVLWQRGWRGKSSTAGEHDVVTMGQGSVGQRLIGLAPHDDSVPPRQLAESRHVLGQVEEQLALAAYRPVTGHGGYELHFHGRVTTWGAAGGRCVLLTRHSCGYRLLALWPMFLANPRGWRP